MKKIEINTYQVKRACDNTFYANKSALGIKGKPPKVIILRSVLDAKLTRRFEFTWETKINGEVICWEYLAYSGGSEGLCLVIYNE